MTVSRSPQLTAARRRPVPGGNGPFLEYMRSEGLDEEVLHLAVECLSEADQADFYCVASRRSLNECFDHYLEDFPYDRGSVWDFLCRLMEFVAWRERGIVRHPVYGERGVPGEGVDVVAFMKKLGGLP